MVRGRFDAVRIEGLVRSKGGQVEDYKGIRLLTVAEPRGYVEIGLFSMGLVAAMRGGQPVSAATTTESPRRA